jgi:hypothetical protein
MREKKVIYHMREKIKRRVNIPLNLEEGVLQGWDVMQMLFSNGWTEVSMSSLDFMIVMHMHLFHL